MKKAEQNMKCVFSLTGWLGGTPPEGTPPFAVHIGCSGKLGGVHLITDDMRVFCAADARPPSVETVRQALLCAVRQLESRDAFDDPGAGA